MAARNTFRKSLNAFVLFLILLTLIPFAHAAEAPRSGGVLHFGVENDFAGFDALKARGLAICGAIANNAINERLFDLDDNGELAPILGLSAVKSQDGLQWTIKLRTGVEFHDGVPFNADAVVAHFSRLLNPANKFPGLQNLVAIKSVQKTDDETVVFHLARPWPAFLSVLCNPRSLVSFIPSPKATEEGRQLRAPVGTGPFMFKEWTTGERFTAVRNPKYWKKGKPFLDEIVFQPMIDHQTRIAALKAGQLDMIWADHGHIINQAESDPSLKIHRGEGSGAEIILLNTAQPPLNDVRVRRALAHAWNQAVYVRMSYQDTIPVVSHPFGALVPCEDSGYLEYDPDKARALLSGIDKPLELEILHSNSRRGLEVGEIAQQMFKEIGVQVKSTGLEFAPVIQRVFRRKFQAATWRIPAMLDYGPLLSSYFFSKSKRNVTGYNNPEMDQLLKAQSRETDAAKREKIMCEIIRILNEDAVILYRGGKRFHIIAKPAVKGIDPIRYGIPDPAEIYIQK